ncbi:hypothetical protein PHISP_00016 [Aspergillus sp. HF37]|nr:hypothetical protein PHISP_00016 [Aspergillus sp. HF37]
MKGNMVIVAVVVSMLGLIGIGVIYIFCWRQAFVEDVEYARDTRRRRPSPDAQRHTAPNARNRGNRRGDILRQQVQMTAPHGGYPRSNGKTTHWTPDAPGPDAGENNETPSGGWAPDDPLASNKGAGNGESRREPSPQRPPPQGNADEWSGSVGAPGPSGGSTRDVNW